MTCLRLTLGALLNRRPVILKQRQYSAKKICVPETVQYTVAFLWCWPMINFLRFGLVAATKVFADPISASYGRSCIEILGLLFTCIFEGFMGRRTALVSIPQLHHYVLWDKYQRH